MRISFNEWQADPRSNKDSDVQSKQIRRIWTAILNFQFSIIHYPYINRTSTLQKPRLSKA